MRTTIASAVFLLVGAGAATIGAKSGISLLGSDTLRSWTAGVIAGVPATGPLPAVAACPNLAGVTYGGTGSTNGLNAMRRGDQEAAPMSSAMNAAGVCTSITGAGVPTNGSEAEGIITALDGLSIAIRGTDAPDATCGGIGYGRVCLGGSNAGNTCTSDANCPGSACSAPSTAARFKVPTDCTALGCVPDGAGGWEYVAADERDFLRLLYFGTHNHSTSGIRNCNSPVRRALASSYKNLFHLPGCTSTACANRPLKHAYRRDDGSGTTEVFGAVIGIPTPGYSFTALSYNTGASPAQRSNPFCNAGDVSTNPAHRTVPGIHLGFDGSEDPPTGPNWNTIIGESDFADLDPIRTPCEIGDDVCGGDGTNGLVQVVFPPELDPRVAYPEDVCDEGSLELPADSAPYTGYFGNCGDGAPSPLGGCVIGYKACSPATPCRMPSGMPNRTSGISHLCIQQSFGVAGSCWFLAPQNGTECRGANNWLRDAAGRLVEEDSLGAARRRVTLGGWFRKHMNFRADGTPMGASACRSLSATANIGCLVGAGENCSVGFAGREATEGAGNVAESARVRNILPTKANVQALITGGAFYPLSRRLYYNTIIGFGGTTNTNRCTGGTNDGLSCTTNANCPGGGTCGPDPTGPGVSGGEYELGLCLSDRLYRPYIESRYGFVEMPESAPGSGIYATCQDVNEVGGGGSCPAAGGVNVNACANNGGIPLRCVGGSNNNGSCTTHADCPGGVCSGSQCAGTSTYCDPRSPATSAGGVNMAQCGGGLCRNRRIPRMAPEL